MQDEASSVFVQEVMKGLSGQPKTLYSKYFYDSTGDQLFQQIMALPEYYLTRTEFEILQQHSNSILEKMSNQRVDIIELGSGDGKKTKILLEAALDRGYDLKYIPIDISPHVLSGLKTSLGKRWPELPVQTISGEYLNSLKTYQAREGSTPLFLFLGSSIGNFRPEAADQFLMGIQELLPPSAFFLIGFDLQKDPEVIYRAYADAKGVTRAFNLNILTRLNRELGANFEKDAFRHWPTYNPLTGAMKSYLVSTRDQQVHFSTLNQTISFRAWEAIDVELSQKYTLPGVEKMAEEAGFGVLHHYQDSRSYFVDSLWQKV